MNTRTTSIRLKDEIVDEIDSKCAKLGCCRNDYIKDAIETKLDGHGAYSKENKFQNCTECDEEVHKAMKKIVDNIHEADYSLADSEKTGKPIKAELTWPDNDDEGFLEKEWQKRQNREEPKPTLVLLD